jgi:hypothetical protein
MNEENKNVLPISLLVYATLVSFLVALGVTNDESLDRASSAVSFSSQGTHIIKYLAILIIIYYVRAGLLLAALLLQDKKWQLVTKLGIGFAVVPEAIVFFSAISLIASSGANCPGPGPFSNCGWGFLIFLPIAGAAAMQVIGMIIGLTIAALRK